MYTQILFATDLLENHFKLCQKAAKIAESFQAKLFLLHVIEPPSSLQLAQSLGFAEFDHPLKADAHTVLRVLGEAINIPVNQQFVEVGSIKMNVLDKIKELNCDLLIIGSHTPSHLPAFLGSTTHAVSHAASCDVLTVRC